jgi:hypothetical protein
MSWREILNPTLETRDKRDKRVLIGAFVPFVTASGGETSKNQAEIRLPEDLRGIDRQYFDDLVEVLVGPKFRMPEAEARRKAMDIVKESTAALRAKGNDAYGRRKDE